MLCAADGQYAMQAVVSNFIQQLYLHNPELSSAAFIVHKDQSEHHADGSVWACVAGGFASVAFMSTGASIC